MLFQLPAPYRGHQRKQRATLNM